MYVCMYVYIYMYKHIYIYIYINTMLQCLIARVAQLVVAAGHCPVLGGVIKKPWFLVGNFHIPLGP